MPRKILPLLCIILPVVYYLSPSWPNLVDSVIAWGREHPSLWAPLIKTYLAHLEILAKPAMADMQKGLWFLHKPSNRYRIHKILTNYKNHSKTLTKYYSWSPPAFCHQCPKTQRPRLHCWRWTRRWFGAKKWPHFRRLILQGSTWRSPWRTGAFQML